MPDTPPLPEDPRLRSIAEAMEENGAADAPGYARTKDKIRVGR